MHGKSAETILVTGASSGIGREIVIQLALPGRVFWLIGRDRERLEAVAELARAKGAVAMTACLDLTDIEAAERFLQEEFPAGSGVDSLYLGAAVSQFGEVKDTLPEDWKRIYQTNLLSPVQWIRHFYAGMVKKKAGKIIIISSVSAYTGYPTATAYATMKAGLLGLFRSLRHEGNAHGISLHLVSPGYVDTAIYKSSIYRKTTYEAIMKQIHNLGFSILSAEDATHRILKNLEKGRKDFAVPGYASMMIWAAPRMPFIFAAIHKKIINSFRQAS